MVEPPSGGAHFSHQTLYIRAEISATLHSPLERPGRASNIEVEHMLPMVKFGVDPWRELGRLRRPEVVLRRWKSGKAANVSLRGMVMRIKDVDMVRTTASGLHQFADFVAIWCVLSDFKGY